MNSVGSQGSRPVALPPERAPAADPRRTRVRLARFLALSVDAIQIVFLPVFAAGGLSWANNALDLVTSLVMIRLLGWHLAFLPTFVIELFPIVDLAPTWTIAVWLVTRGRPKTAPPTA